MGQRNDVYHAEFKITELDYIIFISQEATIYHEDRKTVRNPLYSLIIGQGFGKVRLWVTFWTSSVETLTQR